MKSEHSKLQFITHYTEKYSYIDSARIALEGGCRWIQLRMKDADASTLEETALIVQKMCKGAASAGLAPKRRPRVYPSHDPVRMPRQ